jgi:hypothetical protein
MPKVMKISRQIKHLKGLFDARTYRTFQVVVDGMIKLRQWRQADLALMGGKTLRQVQYFFNGAKWCAQSLNTFRLRFLRNKADFRDRKSDFVVGDGSVLEVDKDSSFSGLAAPVYSNLRKTTVNGIKLFGASVHTKTGLKYVFDFFLYFKSRWKSEFEAWISFLAKVAEKTNAWLFVFDRGFRNKYLAKHVFATLKRMFLMRLSDGQSILIRDPHQKVSERKKEPRYSVTGRTGKKIKSFLKDKTAIRLEKGKLWFISHVVVNAWRDVFREEVSIIVYWQDGFSHPLVLCISKAEITEQEAISFVELYHRRWGIEQLFNELKSWFCLEKFKVISEQALVKYLHLVLFIHSLLTAKKEEIEHVPKLRELMVHFLKRTRNVIHFTLLSLKLCFESLTSLTSSTFKKSLPLDIKPLLAYEFL